MSLLILFVDDDPAIRLEASSSLEISGYSVITASDGKEARKMVEEYQPHLIITDVSMSQMDGYELIRWVRQHPTFRLLPVVFLTAPTDTEKRIRGYQLGCDAYLPKPIELNELYAVVRNLLERSQQILQLMQWESRLRIQEQSIERLTFPADTTHQTPLSQQEQTIQADTIYRKSLSKQKQIVQTAIRHEICLTQREQVVLKFLVEGRSNSQIAAFLYLSRRTVEKYVSNLLGKTGTSNRVELMRFAIENRLISCHLHAGTQ